ncbi:MAG TPA: POTRA domain-containing protein [Candidatus Acidoferrum sp.]|nr:POTRA domain-containing protein [Candidatus Acidoferrum sp.]
MSRMKWRWTNGLRVGVGVALLTGVAAARAQNATVERQVPEVLPTGITQGPQSKITAIRVVTEDGRVLSDCPDGVSVEIGKPLDRADVNASLRALYRTGDYSDLRAVVTPVAGGLRLDFVAKENLYFNRVIIESLTAPPSDASAAAAMQISLGDTYRASTVEEGLQRLRDVLRDEGLYRAEVSAETQPHPDTHQMDVVVHIKPGPRALAGDIVLSNGTEFPAAIIIARTKIKTGKEVTSARLQKGTERVRKFLIKKGHLSARAVIRRGAYDPAKNAVALNLEVNEGPRIQVVVMGAKVSKGELKKLVPIYQEGAVDTDLLEEGKRNLRERLERQGYFDAKVDYKTDTHAAGPNATGWQGSEETITYNIDRGDRHKLAGIEISGNRYFATTLLKGRLQISAVSFGLRSHFSQRLLDSDVQSMRNVYLSNGFLDANVKATVQDDYKGRAGDRLVRFNIVEGPQTSVASLAIDGIHAFKEAELLAVVGSVPGQPYSDANVASDRDNILARYFNEGYPEATFTSTAERLPSEEPQGSGEGKAEDATPFQKKLRGSISPAPQAPPVRLVYHIQEGPQTRVRRVLLSGYKHTREGVVRREVQVKAHQPLRESDVVESQRRLYNLGVFNRVTIGPQNPTGSDPDKDIVVLVEEAKRYTIAYGGGFEVQRLASGQTGGTLQAAPRGIFEITRNNLTGRADSLSLRVRGSTIEDRILLGYTHPNLLSDRNLNLQVTAYTEKSQDINTFTQSRYEASVQLTDVVTPHTTLVYRYAFRKVLISNLNGTIAPEEIPLFEQPTLVSEFGATWIRDTRDNPAEATKGTFNSGDVALADTTIGSSASFLRLFFQNSTYYPLRGKFSFARSIRIGILQPYRDTVSLTFPAQQGLVQLIPLPERFYAGGGTSLRGFALNQAGPRDSLTGYPVGGQALLVLNQEVRFPMHLPFIGSALGGAIFYDGGNVFSQLSRVTFRYRPPTPVFDTPTHCQYNCTNELNYFSHTVGFGVRYATPVGPIRVDLGYQINRPLFVIPVPTPGISPDPNMCPAMCQGTRLPKFQIFFNLGPSF